MLVFAAPLPAPPPPPTKGPGAIFSLGFPEHETVTWRHPTQQLTIYRTGTPTLSNPCHGLIKYKDTKTKCRLYWCLIKLIAWRYSQSCWYFGPSFVNNCPSNLLSCSPPIPPPHSKSQSKVQTVCVWEGVGGGALSCVGDRILQEFNTLYLTRFRTYKIALPPQTKPKGGRGPQTDKHLAQSPFTDKFFR